MLVFFAEDLIYRFFFVFHHDIIEEFKFAAKVTWFWCKNVFNLHLLCYSNIEKIKIRESILLAPEGLQIFCLGLRYVVSSFSFLEETSSWNCFPHSDWDLTTSCCCFQSWCWRCCCYCCWRWCCCWCWGQEWWPKQQNSCSWK